MTTSRRYRRRMSRIYRQGSGWIFAVWDEHAHWWALSGELSYAWARELRRRYIWEG